jgi:hypothetical protein
LVQNQHGADRTREHMQHQTTPLAALKQHTNLV